MAESTIQGLLNGMDPAVAAQITALMGAGGLTDEEKRQQKQQAAFAAAAGFLSNMYKPTGIGIGAGIGAGLLGYNEAGQSLRRDRLAGAENMHKAIQSYGAIQGMNDQAQERKILQGFYGRQGAPGNTQPIPQAPVGMGPPDLQGGLSQQPAPPLQTPLQGTPAAPASTDTVSLRKQRSDQMRALGDAFAAAGRGDQAQKYYDAAEKMLPKVKEQSVGTDPATGKRVKYVLYEDGTTNVLPLGPDKEKAHFLDVGNKIGAVDPFTGQPVAGGGMYNKAMTPGETASNQVALANLALSRNADARAAANQGANAWDTNIDRGIQVNKQTAETRPITSGGVPIGNAAELKKTQQAGGALAIIDQAEPIIKKATGSYVGAGIDKGAQMFGLSTKGADATAQLQALEGALMMSQPRMEGPQSDKDTALYKQMAGKIGDPTVPESQKLAALKVIREMHKRYANPQGQGQPKTVKWSDLP